MKRLLLAYLYCNLGGVTSVWKQRMPALHRKGWSVDAIFQRDYGGAGDLRMSGVAEVSIGGNDLIKATAQKIHTTRYDLVTLVDTPDLIVPVRDIFSGKLVYEIHTPTGQVVEMNRAEDLRRCDLILVPSEWSKRWVLAHFPSLDADLLQVCPNIVSDQDFRSDGAQLVIDRHPELLWVGKLHAYKNWREAVRVASLAASRRNFTFTMVTGSLVNQQLAHELLAEWLVGGIADRARWLHNLPLSAMGELYRQAARSRGVLLSTSLSESFCFVIHEALRCGLPVVATSVGACPEIVQHEVSGLLYEPGEEAAAADHVDRLLADPDLRKNLIDGAGTVLANFDGMKLANRYIELLESPSTNRSIVRSTKADFKQIQSDSRRQQRFVGTSTYWEQRYFSGGNSGVGSYGKFAEFKAEIINDFIKRKGITSVIEFGSGDGNQLKLIDCEEYLGFDISPAAIARCKALYRDDPTKTFRLSPEYSGEKADLSLSMDVLFHLVEDDMFELYVKQLFGSGRYFVIIYSSDIEENTKHGSPHVRHRRFTQWVRDNIDGWELEQHIPNKYPYRSDDRTGSLADFYIYRKKTTPLLASREALPSGVVASEAPAGSSGRPTLPPAIQRKGRSGTSLASKFSHVDLEVAIALVDEQFADLPYMSTRQALRLTALIKREGLTSLLELGTFQGKSTAYMAAALEVMGRGSLVTIDQVAANAKKPNVYQVLKSLGLSHRVRVYLEPRSLTWRLMRLIEEHESPCFDFCYFDGGHSWDVTGYAFFLVDQLLKPGGWVVFDDLDWTYERMIKPGEPLPDFLSDVPEEERRTAQVGKVWDLLVCRSTGYERHEVIGNWGVARKRSFSA